MAPKAKPVTADGAVIENDGLDFSENQGRVLDPKLDAKSEKKAKKEKRRKEKGGGGFRVGRLIAILLGLLLMAGVVVALYFDLFGVRTGIIVPLIQSIPIVNNLVAPADDSGTVTAPPEELLAQIQELQARNDQLTADIQTLTDRNRIYADEVARLQEFETAQARFRQEKDEFDRLVAMNDPAAYSSFYESVSPENAQSLYQEAVTTVAASKDFKKYINTIAAIEAADAALILDEMTRTQMDLVVLILNNLDSEVSGEILANMKTRNAVAAVRRMAPEQ